MVAEESETNLEFYIPLMKESDQAARELMFRKDLAIRQRNVFSNDRNSFYEVKRSRQLLTYATE